MFPTMTWVWLSLILLFHSFSGWVITTSGYPEAVAVAGVTFIIASAIRAYTGVALAIPLAVGFGTGLQAAEKILMGIVYSVILCFAYAMVSTKAIGQVEATQRQIAAIHWAIAIFASVGLAIGWMFAAVAKTV